MAKTNISDYILDDSIKGLRSSSAIDLYTNLKICKQFANIINPQNKPNLSYSSDGKSHTSLDGPIYIDGNVKNLDLSIGLTIHESGHKKFSRNLFLLLEAFNNQRKCGDKFQFWSNVTEKLDWFKPSDKNRLASYKFRKNSFYENISNYEFENLFKTLINVLEDRRIDFKLWKEAPGWREYYLLLYKTYFWTADLKPILKSTTKFCEPTVDSYIFRIININNKNNNLKALKGLKEIKNIINLNNIINDTPSDIFFKVLDILEIINENVIINSISNHSKLKSKSNSKDENESNSDFNDSNEDEDSNEDSFDSNSNEQNRKETDSNLSDSDFNIDELLDEYSNEDSELIDSESNLCRVLNKQRNFVNGEIEIKKVKKYIKTYIKNLEQSNADVSNLKYYNKVQVITLKNVSPEIDVSGCLSKYIPSHSIQWNKDYNKWIKGKSDANKIKDSLHIINDTRTIQHLRKKHGNLDNRLIAESRSTDRVFQTKIVEEAQSTYIHLSLDVSISISNDQLVQIKYFIWLLSNLFYEMKDIHIQVVARVRNKYLYNVYLYDSKTMNLNSLKRNLKHLITCGDTPESLNFDASLNEIIKNSKNKNAFFITMSDGAPGCYVESIVNNKWIGYTGINAYEHIKKMVTIFENANIIVKNYFLANNIDNNSKLEDHISNNYIKAYKNKTKLLDFENLKEIVKELNKLLIESKVKF